jgi:hypothetical protein
MSSIFKYLKSIIFIILITTMLLFISSGCDILSYKGSYEGQKETATIKKENADFNDKIFSYPVRDYPIGKSKDSNLYWDCSDNDFGNYLGTYNGYHSGEDWNLKGAKDGEVDNGKPVYSIGEGKVVVVSDLKSLGYLVIIEHEGNFTVPAKEINSNNNKASYKKETVNKIYSVYLHLKDIKVKKDDKVNENTVLGYIMNPGGGSHLHFEIRKNNDGHDSSWSLVGDSTNWQKFPDDGYNGYYKDLQKMIDSGLRDPTDFIEANKKEAKAAAQSSAVETTTSENTIPETTAVETTMPETLNNSGKIAFMSNRDGNSEIYVINQDGSGLVNLTNNPADDVYPAWSPDGSRVAFVSGRDGNYEIYVMNADGSDVTRLTNNPADDEYPAFSPISEATLVNNETVDTTTMLATEKIGYSLGDIGPAGGLIFYINPNYENDGWHYLEAAPCDQSTGIKWNNGINIETGATATKVGAGKTNTQIIINNQSEGRYAAQLCSDLTISGYSDWFLPSKDELDLMYKNLKRADLGDFSYFYWSSSESTWSSNYAWMQYFYDGSHGEGDKGMNNIRVRAARAF